MAEQKKTKKGPFNETPLADQFADEAAAALVKIVRAQARKLTDTRRPKPGKAL